jgi:hypothetical protein
MAFRGVQAIIPAADPGAAGFGPNARLSGGPVSRCGAGVCRTSRQTGWRWLAWATACTGTARDISRFRRFCGLPSTVTAATSISADAFARGSSGRPRGARLERVLTRNLGPSSIPSLGDGVMLGTAWIDRPVDTQGRAPCFHVLLSAAWKHGHAQANDRHSSRVFAMPPRGFARTTRNG